MKTTILAATVLGVVLGVAGLGAATAEASPEASEVLCAYGFAQLCLPSAICTPKGNFGTTNLPVQCVAF